MGDLTLRLSYPEDATVQRFGEQAKCPDCKAPVSIPLRPGEHGRRWNEEGKLVDCQNREVS